MAPSQTNTQGRQWRSAVDPKTGRTYYYDVVTRETQWRKPPELATPAERRELEMKEKRQKDFFKSMEANMLHKISLGLPIVEHEDEISSMPVAKTIKKPKPMLVRTISAMDEEILADMAEVEEKNVHHIKNSYLYPLKSLGYERSISEKNNVKAHSSLPKPKLIKRNTCGTMYVNSTMSAPDKDAMIRCVCGIYRTHIVQTEREKQSSSQTRFNEYDIFNDHPSDRGENSSCPYPASRSCRSHTETTSIVSSDNGIETLCIPSSPVPSLDEIISFYANVFRKAQMETDCIIMSLIYVERLIKQTKGSVRPSIANWRSLLFSCMIMASKVWDDLSMWNADFGHTCPKGVKFSLQRINELELAILDCLRYGVKVTASEYAKYYFLMRSMLIRSGLTGEEISDTPLDTERAAKLEFSSSRLEKQSELQNAYRSKSVGENDGDNGEGYSGSPKCVSLEQVVNMTPSISTNKNGLKSGLRRPDPIGRAPRLVA
eukprot:CAMPEP_0184860284 /NCGR_PEP_ID=MMETSP0580-20130426/5199_1 /TAXON_ID=1118495 /ORGANISM="Dactyliosolen fragilissimus" /LENGTH=487 /DNA_ID=CAMNT_0027357331 /DNA_START=35 /DNA_END=1498 /DNA_ORIENTATION=-